MSRFVHMSFIAPPQVNIVSEEVKSFFYPRNRDKGKQPGGGTFMMKQNSSTIAVKGITPSHIVTSPQ
ncbi:MAG: hypothetical protein AB9903_34160 [Vulcanimicrobiota bacterium]